MRIEVININRNFIKLFFESSNNMIHCEQLADTLKFISLFSKTILLYIAKRIVKLIVKIIHIRNI